MEEILSSIKRIIAEEGDSPPGRRRAGARAAAAAPPPVAAEPEPPLGAEPAHEEEILELSDPMPVASHVRLEEDAAMPDATEEAVAPVQQSASSAQTLLSPAAADATRGALESLSRLMIKPEPQGDGTLEGLVRDMLRPMLREWMDAHLPDMVERMVSREIARIAGQAQ
ncbi:hypothetical protein CKY28_03715 [Sphingomonas lenta]|uniref:Pole-organizing protein PopZ n=2 Tax=Sphingomonas lenta TaxID=1141887 RepID=A0A2A2SIR8_9SPHN|nr:hypothetical protein CKY28_03715 [Sphingomonas lenta]